MSNRNPDRLAFGFQPPMVCARNYRSGGPIKTCFYFDCQGCMMYPRLKKSWEETDLLRGRCLLPIPGGWRSQEVPHANEVLPLTDH